MGRGGHAYSTWCNCKKCKNRTARAEQEYNERQSGGGNWSEPMGGGDSAGNELTVAFGEGRREGETFLADGDASEENFLDHDRHDHYGSGNGPNDNGTSRGRYSGPGA